MFEKISQVLKNALNRTLLSGFVFISRILYPPWRTIVIYLALKLLQGSSDSDFNVKLKNTILHKSKDLAVSIICFHMRHPCGASVFQLGRLCSHLIRLGRRWELPPKCFISKTSGRSSPKRWFRHYHAPRHRSRTHSSFILGSKKEGKCARLPWRGCVRTFLCQFCPPEVVAKLSIRRSVLAKADQTL